MKRTGEALLEEAEEIGRVALAELLDDGLQADEALDLLAALVDAALPLRALLPPPFGSLAEQHDGPAIRELLAQLRAVLRRDPDKIDARADKASQRGHFLVAARRHARAARARNQPS